MISFSKAKAIISGVEQLGSEEINASIAVDRVLDEDVFCLVDSPPRDSSLKDGFALRAEDIVHASSDSPVRLIVSGTLWAGQKDVLEIGKGQAVRIMTGARIPSGANAVLPQELADLQGDHRVLCRASTFVGRNILKQGADIRKGELLLKKGTVLTPPLVGLLTGAGVSRIKVVRSPSVAIVATGSELAEEGKIDESEKIFPSNRSTIYSWLRRYGIKAKALLCRDEPVALHKLLDLCLADFDVVITSGGVLDGQRDLVVSTFQELGVEFLFQRVRMGPGKGVCMGVKGKKLVFNLPGGPPSNYVAFMFIALSAILRLMGRRDEFPPVIKATIGSDVKGREDWTQLLLAKTCLTGWGFFTMPVVEESRLKRIAFSDSAIVVPEGVRHIKAGQETYVALFELSSPFLNHL